ncbi:sensor histidine kinase [Streptomyces sp. NPDC127110]|uniref:sensor histidine kinase n=1 Tax=Streptomyces sp. NPDC127110 TaxID=3345362 RepID=UPI003625F959
MWLRFLSASCTRQNLLIAAFLLPVSLTLALHDTGPGVSDDQRVRISVAIAVLALTVVHHRCPWVYALAAGVSFLVTGMLMTMGVAAMAAVRFSRPVLAVLSVAVPTAVTVWLPSLAYGGDIDPLVNLYQTLTALLLPLGIGALARAALQRSELERRNYRQQAELREAGIRERRMQERAALARSVHDGVGRQSSLIALRAGAIRANPDATPRIRELSQAISDSATAAMREVRHFLDLVGSDAPDGGPAPGVEPRAGRPESAGPALRAVVEEFRGVGLRIALDVLPGAGEDVGPRTAGLLADVACEALTNAVRHAPGAAVRVRLSRQATRTVLTVCNGPAPAPEPGLPGTGNGLALLSRQVEEAAGTLRARPVNGGFIVTACLPLQP